MNRPLGVLPIPAALDLIERIRRARVMATDGMTPAVRTYFGAVVTEYDKQVGEGIEPERALGQASRAAIHLLPDQL